jgi:hypothetical protein
MANKKILLYHRNKSVKTIKEFIDSEHLNIKEQDLFEENKERIFSQMTETDKTSYKDSNGTYPTSGSDLNVNMELPCPCSLLINPEFITAEIAINQTNLQTDSEDFYSFEDEQIQEVKNDESYSDELDKRAPTCQVIGWFKNLYRSYVQSSGFGVHLDARYGYKNLSLDIISLQTSVGKNGGNFSIRLPHIDITKESTSSVFSEDGLEYSEADSYSMNADRNFLLMDSKESSMYGFQHFERSNFNSMKDYYSTLISSNDLLFLSFHHNNKDIEKNGVKRKLSNKNPEVIGVADGNYDMIGLVDEVRIVTDSQGTQIAVDVSGRDLMKLLIEDGSFFFNPSVVSDSSRIFWNDKKQGDILSVTQLGGETNPLQRMIGGSRDVSNMISVFAHRQNMSVEFILKAVISQLANIEILPGDAFDGFPNRTTFLELKPEEK